MSGATLDLKAQLEAERTATRELASARERLTLENGRLLAAWRALDCDCKVPGGVKCRDAIREGFQRPLREENTRLAAEVESLKANIVKAEIAAEGCWLDAKDAGPWYASTRWRCRHGHASVVACLLAAVKGCHGNSLAIDGASDKRAIRQPGGAK